VSGLSRSRRHADQRNHRVHSYQAAALRATRTALRSIFDLDSVALFRRTDGGWRVDDAVGAPVPQRPEDAQFKVDLTEGRLLALSGSRLTEEDAELLQVLLAEVRQIRERAQVAQLPAE